MQRSIGQSAASEHPAAESLYPIPHRVATIYRLLFLWRFPHTSVRTSCDERVRHPAGRLRKILRRDFVSFPVS